VEKLEPDKKQANDFMELAKRDLIAAEDNIKSKHADWALAIAYNAMLYAGRALMTMKGYRPTSDSHHLGVVQFCAAVMPKESAQLASTFNRYRVRRHDVVYGEAKSVGENEAENSIKNARLFIEQVSDLIK
jgi:uncharacterized protein (UPF0332 family)